MRQAIVVKYHGPTNSSGTRLSASSQAGRVYYPRNHALNVDDDYSAAAERYAKKMGWLRADEKLVGGSLPDGDSAAFLVVRK